MGCGAGLVPVAAAARRPDTAQQTPHRRSPPDVLAELLVVHLHHAGVAGGLHLAPQHALGLRSAGWAAAVSGQQAPGAATWAERRRGAVGNWGLTHMRACGTDQALKQGAQSAHLVKLLGQAGHDHGGKAVVAVHPPSAGLRAQQGSRQGQVAGLQAAQVQSEAAGRVRRLSCRLPRCEKEQARLASQALAVWYAAKQSSC